MSSFSGRPRKRSAFEWHGSQDARPPPTVRIRHSDININFTGPSSIQSSSITAPASPSKTTPTLYRDDYLLHQIALDMEVDDGLGGLGDEVEVGGIEGLEDGEGDAEGAVDPQYQLHLEENLRGTRQKRTQVRSVDLHTDVFI